MPPILVTVVPKEILTVPVCHFENHKPNQKAEQDSFKPKMPLETKFSFERSSLSQRTEQCQQCLLILCYGIL